MKLYLVTLIILFFGYSCQLTAQTKDPQSESINLSIKINRDSTFTFTLFNNSNQKISVDDLAFNNNQIFVKLPSGLLHEHIFYSHDGEKIDILPKQKKEWNYPLLKFLRLYRLKQDGNYTIKWKVENFNTKIFEFSWK